MREKTISRPVENDEVNPLRVEKESKLIVDFAVPCIISMLVTSLYNIVDQIFIGQGVGMLGNAATNIAFPLSIACTAISLLLGIGAASNFSLHLGAGEEKKAVEYAGTGLCLMTICGIALFLVTTLFLTPMLKFFGATPDVLPYAEEYTRITAIGFPFLIANTGISKLILADGSPRYSMTSMLVGAIVNTILDPLFIFGMNMGMRGAALATIIGQIVSFCISLRYLFHFKTVKLHKDCLRLSWDRTCKICSYGASAGFNQVAMAVVQIVMNNTLAHYGALSVYGSDIPLACAGIISKVNMIFMSFVIGISQGIQPIIGYNHGAMKPARVLLTLKYGVLAGTSFTTLGFLACVFFPRGIAGLFTDDASLISLAANGLIICVLAFPLIGSQIIIGNFFQAIGKARLAIFLSLTRQMLFLLPFLLVLPRFWGQDGIWASLPLADVLSFIVTLLFIRRFLKYYRLKNRHYLVPGTGKA